MSGFRLSWLCDRRRRSCAPNVVNARNEGTRVYYKPHYRDEQEGTLKFGNAYVGAGLTRMGSGIKRTAQSSEVKDNASISRVWGANYQTALGIVQSSI